MADSLATTSAETSSESDRAVAHQQRSVTNSVRRWPTWRRLALAGICYLTLSVVIWWHVWSAPTVTATSINGDPALFLWYLEWPAYALAHGANPFFSTAMFHPGGVNLLANTSVLGIGIPLAPLTWAFGPVLTLNVALTLGPALSALAMFYLLCRWVRWAPAAFAGGLLYGFSPLVLNESPPAHLMVTWLLVPPLIVACLDALLVGTRVRATRIGILLALLLAVQFFLSTEILALTVLMTAVGLILVVGFVSVRDPGLLASRWRRVGTGLGTAGLLTVALLGFPSWYATFGPAHYVGLVWPALRNSGGTPGALFDSSTTLSFAQRAFVQMGGYFGHPLPSETYVGAGLLIVLGAATVAFGRDRRLWLLWALALTAGLLTLGTRQVSWAPWGLFSRIPVIESVIPERFIVFVYLSLGVVLAVVVDSARSWALGADWSARSGARWFGMLAGLAVAVAALAQMAVLFAPELPYTVGPVRLPAWYEAVAPRLPKGQVLLGFPTASSGYENVLAWQAVNRMHYSVASGGGPQGTAAYARTTRKGFGVLASLSFDLSPAPQATPANLVAARQAIEDWGVTRIVVPLDAVQPGLVAPHDPRYAVAFFTAATGDLPSFSHQAWVFNVTSMPEPLHVAAGAVNTCSAAGPPAGLTVPLCVEHATIGTAAQ